MHSASSRALRPTNCQPISPVRSVKSLATRSFCLGLITSLLFVFSPLASAGTIDWSTVSWTNGVKNQTLVASDGTNVNFAFSEHGGAELKTPTGASDPAVPFVGANKSGFDNFLQSWMTLTDRNGTSFVALDLSFDQVVTDVVLSLGDIDGGNPWDYRFVAASDSSPTFDDWQDNVVLEASLLGSRVDGIAVDFPAGAASSVALDGANDYKNLDNVVLYSTKGNVPSQNSVPNPANPTWLETDGNVSVSVSGPIDHLRIDFRPGREDDGLPFSIVDVQGGRIDPQLIRMHDISFNVVPEPSGLLLASLAGVAGMLFYRGRRKRGAQRA